MKAFDRIFRIVQPSRPVFTWADAVLLLFLGSILVVAVIMADKSHHAAVIAGPDISLSPLILPYYASLSVLRMAAAYLLSLLFTIIYGYQALRSKRAEQVLLPVLDILQSVPILSYLPLVLLALSAVIPTSIAVEITAIVLIFTSQVWNMTFVWYQSLTTQPNELREACRVYRFTGWMRFRVLDLPFGTIGLVWNSMMSWAGGWFFLMAAEGFTVGGKDFRLPGLGSYLQEAASKESTIAMCYGLGTLLLIIIGMDQLVWRPLLAWSDRFRVEMTEGDQAPESWFYNLLVKSNITTYVREKYIKPATEWMDGSFAREVEETFELAPVRTARVWFFWMFVVALAIGLVLAAGYMVYEMTLVKGSEWAGIALGILVTFVRVAVALTISLAWTIPIGVAIGTNRKLADWLQPVAQVAASVPATALFPALLLFALKFSYGLQVAVIVLLLLGTQWYLLFNIIAGASAIPQDLRNTARILQLPKWEFWKTLILPALFPYIVTGAITASGGAWNATVVAEYVLIGGKPYHVTGIGGSIAEATAASNYPVVFAATVCMIVTVVAINRFVWRRLYHLAEVRYRID
jgi:NitT/TauT family transport system permease protein